MSYNEDNYETFTIFDDIDLPSFHDSLENCVSRIAHSEFRGLTKHFCCHYWTKQHKPILEFWQEQWTDFDKQSDEDKQFSLQKGRLVLYAIAEFIKRHGLGKFMAELQEIYANFDECSYFPQDDAEEVQDQ